MERAPSFHEVWRYLHISQEGRAIVSGVEERWRSAGAAETQLSANVTETLQAYVRDGASVAAFQDLFLVIALLYLGTAIPALLGVPPKREKGGGSKV